MGFTYGNKDHPRVCGEKPRPRLWRVPAKGSPPRVRGKVHQRGVFAFGIGITPACAGKRKVGCACGGRREDHPRVCGEKVMIFS